MPWLLLVRHRFEPAEWRVAFFNACFCRTLAMAANRSTAAKRKKTTTTTSPVKTRTRTKGWLSSMATTKNASCTASYNACNQHLYVWRVARSCSTFNRNSLHGYAFVCWRVSPTRRPLSKPLNQLSRRSTDYRSERRSHSSFCASLSENANAATMRLWLLRLGSFSKSRRASCEDRCSTPISTPRCAISRVCNRSSIRHALRTTRSSRR